MTHYPNCNANYPEKVKGEAPQQLTVIDIGGGEQIRQCVDCGAYEPVPKKRPSRRA